MSLNRFHRLKIFIATLLISSCATQQPAITASKKDVDLERLSTQMQANDYKQALSSLKELQKRYPQNTAIFVNYALIYKNRNKPEKALEMINRALKISPDHPAANNLLGILRRESGDLDGALNAYKKAIASKPDYALAHINLGILYDIYFQNFNLAQKHYLRYMEITGQPDKQVNGWLADLKRRK